MNYRTAFALYEQRRQIGVGGCGIVYEVANEDGELFALKVLHSNVERRRLKRFKNEIAFCQRNSHENIIRILDHGVTEDANEQRPFYVMPLYPSTLRDLINRGIPHDDVLRLFDQILSGAEAAHLLGVVHRDLKPENVLVGPADERLVLADFGIASFREEDLLTAVETGAGERLANFRYAAPEQKERGREATGRADIFALGLMLNEMFTSTVPSGTNFRRVADVSENHRYLDAIIDSMIRQDPEQRPDAVRRVKSELIARGNEFISLQRLDHLKAEVIPDDSPDDPLVRDPIRIVSFDYAGARLVFQLSRPPVLNWVRIFHGGQWNRSSLSGYGPDRFEFQSSRMSVQSPPEQQVQTVVDYAKSYVGAVNGIYSERVEKGLREQREQLRRQRVREIEEEERRQRVLRNTRL
ncbi:MAG TPA: serine/threonine-protein kinase [Candidatus Dormibacteraeota bacterium]|nr:serine/threonine-protein kinase [Candidatus Dormibacteraeota bacterium]